jgi:hypothetical protein
MGSYSDTAKDIGNEYRYGEGEHKSCLNGIHKLNVDE